MNQIEKFELLAECYRSDLRRLEGIKEAAWYFSQLGGEEIDYYSIAEQCDAETTSIQLKLPDLENLILEMKNETTS